MSSSRPRWQGAIFSNIITIDDDAQSIDLDDDSIDLTNELIGSDEVHAVDEDEPFNFILDDPIELPGDHSDLDSFPLESGEFLKHNDTVELADGSYLRVIRILESSERVYLRGILIKKNNQVDRCYWKINDDVMVENSSKLPHNEVELCAVVYCDVTSSDPSIRAGLVNRPLSEVRHLRAVVITNQPDENFSPWERPVEGYTTDITSKEKPLRCVRKYVVGKQKPNHSSMAYELRILNLNPDECDPGWGVAKHQLFEQWRRPSKSKKAVSSDTVAVPLPFRKGSKRAHKDIIDLTEAGDVPSKRVQRQSQSGLISAQFTINKEAQSGTPQSRTVKTTYNFLDACCGGGGTAWGAHKAGANVLIAIDHNLQACLSVEFNIPSCQVLHMDITTFITEYGLSGITIDILHVSFPCPAFSIANPGTNQKSDEANIHLGYALEDLIKKVRPRVVTMEQVPGILSNSDRSQAGQHFFAQINALTSLGYQVRCGVLKMTDFGIPQMRKRLFTIAACPGQDLPPLPKPTHGYGAGQKKPVSVNDILAQVPGYDAAIMRHYSANRYARPQLNPQLVTQTITCSGGAGIHPIFGRRWSPQEAAMLQGFPARYHFEGNVTQVKRQAGNAVPPPCYEAVVKEILRTLEETDAEFARYDASTYV